VLVKDLSGLLDGYLRISVGTREDNEILLQALEEAMPPEAILFDMDGVLIDVSSSYLLAIKETAEHFLGEEIGMDEVDGYKRRGYNDEWELTQAILESRGLDIPMERIIEKFQQFYLGEDLDGLIKNESWLLGNDLLKRLKRDYKLGIVTGRPRREAEYALDRFRMMEYFDVLVAREDAPRKPDPSGIRLALQKLGVQRAVYVGDNLADIEAARGAGITPIAVGRLLGTKLFIKSVDELEEAL
jgi:HAD superfamily phosphatase